MKFGGKVSWLQPFAISFLYSSIRIVYIIHITVEQYCKAFTTSALSAHAGKVISFLIRSSWVLFFLFFFHQMLQHCKVANKLKPHEGINKQQVLRAVGQSVLYSFYYSI